MRRSGILLASALLAFAAKAATAGSLDFWENSRGAEDVTAHFPTGNAQVAEIYFDADSAETGGLVFGATEMEFRATGSVDFTGFQCGLAGCNAADWAMGPTTKEPFEFVRVNDSDTEEKHGLYHMGTITFDGPQQPGSMFLYGCNYTTLDYVERTCTQFVVVQLPEPARASALLAGAALLVGLCARRRAR
jgi:hypothetical protein